MRDRDRGDGSRGSRPGRPAAAAAAALLVLGALASSAGAEPTRVTVRVLSRGAKFVGTSMGGARVLLRDADTGRVLAEGETRGGTGDTERIMRREQPHWAPVATEDAARFEAVLELEAPRRIEAVAFGPAAQPQAANRVSATQWVLPGKDLTGGNGWLLVLPGFSVDVLAPPTPLRLAEGAREVPLRANVTLMCGCPVVPGGLWDAEAYEIRARVHREGERVAELPLEYAGRPSQFEGSFRAESPGTYEVVVYAYDPATGNTGLDRATFGVPE